MWDFSIRDALSLMLKTMPFVGLRVLVYFGMALAYVLVTGVGVGVGWGVGAFGGPDFQGGAMAWGGVIGFVLTAGILYFLREYILYMLKGAHIAVLVELIDGRDIPQGRSQIAFGAEVVRQRFLEANVLFGIDQLVKGVLRAVLGLVQGLANFLPIPGLQNVVALVRAFLRIAIGLVDEVILGYLIHTKATNPWASSQTALVLYAQNYKVMLRNAAWLTAMMYAVSFVVFLIALAPAIALVAIVPNAWGAAGIFFAIVFAWAVQAALLEPLAIAALLSLFFRVIEGQEPDPAWAARMSQVSKKFNQLDEQAARWVGAQRPPPTAGFTAPGGPVA